MESDGGGLLGELAEEGEGFGVLDFDGDDFAYEGGGAVEHDDEVGGGASGELDGMLGFFPA